MEEKKQKKILVLEMNVMAPIYHIFTLNPIGHIPPPPIPGRGGSVADPDDFCPDPAPDPT